MENSLAHVFDPDILTSTWEGAPAKSALAPEQRLMLAVLEDAIRCIQKYVRNPRSRVCRDAANWILEQHSDGLFSFDSVCAVLGLDSDYLRQGLLTWKGKQAIKIRRHSYRRSVKEKSEQGVSLRPS